MGFWDFLTGSRTSGAIGGPAQGSEVDYAWFTPRVEYLSGNEWSDRIREELEEVRGMSPARMWRTQPHLRTVLSFLGRNVAQLGLQTFQIVSETDRVRDRGNPFAQALRNPGDRMTSYDLIFALTVDKMLYDVAYWIPWMDKTGKWHIRRIPPSWVSPLDRDAFGVTKFRIALKGGSVDVTPDQIIVFGGYSPTSLDGCSPAIDALKETLVEQMESSKYRSQVWRRGGRASAVLKRPLEAPAWTPDQAERFREDWYANYTGDGPRAGGTPLLEDGMELQKIDFSAHEQQWAEGYKLSFNTVAAIFHVNPTMVGQLDNANYSNVREFRRMLYGDTLGPYLAEAEAVFNTFVLPFMGIDPDVVYAEFNIGEKLQGSFEEQAGVMSTMVGAPIMTRNEGRARFNLPALPEGDALVTPLNVLVGGQASPQDSGTQNETAGSAARGPVHVKSRAEPSYEQKVAEVVGAFFKRQESAVRSRLGTKDAEDWWDEERWNSELSDDLYALSLLVTKQVASKTLDAIGFSPDEFDEERTYAWLKEVSARSAGSLNETTKAKLQEALSEDDPDSKVDAVFAAQDSRATMVAVSTVTLLSGFASTEAAKQTLGDAGTKTWVTGSNPRADHAALDGETVLLSENFSNGAAWPGDGSALGAEDIANCNCELQINTGTDS